jgi:transposase
MQDVEDEPLFAERVAGIDIAKAGIEVAVRVPSDTTAGRRQQETRSFRTTRKELLALADWLRSWGVTKVGMESTGDYWKPVYFLLEQQDLDCVLYHAAQVKALPGRPKTDPLTDHLGVFSQLAGRVVMGVATVAGHDRRRGWAAGSGPAGGAALRVA